VNTNASITETVQVSKETQLVSSLSLQSFGRLGSSLSLCNKFVVGAGLSAYGAVVAQLTLSRFKSDASPLDRDECGGHAVGAFPYCDAASYLAAK
jgi:hypothetical protein